MTESRKPLLPNNGSVLNRARSHSLPHNYDTSSPWSDSDTQSFILKVWEEDGSETRSNMNSFTLVVMCALIASLTSLLLGYDVGIFSSAILYIQEEMNLSLFQSEAVVAALNLVAALGSLVAGWMADVLGRKAAIGCACIIFICGAAVMTCSTTFLVIMSGRILTGLGVGCGFVISPVYVTEIAPVSIRGRLVSFCGENVSAPSSDHWIHWINDCSCNVTDIEYHFFPVEQILLSTSVFLLATSQDICVRC